MAVTGPSTTPNSSQLPSGTSSSPAIETAASPGTTNTYPAKMPTPMAPAIRARPVGPITGPAVRAMGEASTTCTST